MEIEASFDRQALERAMTERVEEHLDEIQNAIRSLAVQLQGWPVEEIKPLVQARWRDLGGEITDPELTEVATALSRGAKINLIRE